MSKGNHKSTKASVKNLQVLEMKQHKKVRNAVRYQTKLNRDPDIEKECFICNTQDSVQEHHVFKVEYLVKLIMGIPTDVDLSLLYIPTKLLCDRHHHKIHNIMEGRYFADNFNSKELDRYQEMLDEVDVEKHIDSNLKKRPIWASQYNEMWNDSKRSTEAGINIIRDEYGL